jgi:phenylacetate-CoA ligase
VARLVREHELPGSLEESGRAVDPLDVHRPILRARLAADLAERVEQVVGVTIEVDVVAPGSLERSQGKAKRIDDRR